MANKEKRPAEMEAPTGTVTITLPDYNMFSGEEQEKAVKVIELIWMALQVNGFEERDRDIDPGNTLPSMFIRFYGHVCSLEFVCHMNGYESGYDTRDHNEYQRCEIRLTEKEKILRGIISAKTWLHGILEGMKHDA